MSATVISALLIQALITVESHGDDRALGDYVRGRPTSFGCLQISKTVLVEVSGLTGHRVGVEDAFDRPMAVKICLVYLAHYATEDRLGHTATDQDLARIWNGGPNGWCDPKTIYYWRKVQRELNKLSPARLRVGSTNTKSRHVGLNPYRDSLVATAVVQPSCPTRTGVRAGGNFHARDPQRSRLLDTVPRSRGRCRHHDQTGRTLRRLVLGFDLGVPRVDLGDLLGRILFHGPAAGLAFDHVH